ncbi:uncharacterized protein LOC118744428 isoform X3 [Rhagoletis pomonella]|uniref:uncharacterized protein LOC118744428 isoform X3 n=2 Tax=Rhagoletis TaxID=28609 RepID=UPI0017852A3D|nr:uncharacterized protein LOC118744428 isoform X3 [Rhagoletis pomonella]
MVAGYAQSPVTVKNYLKSQLILSYSKQSLQLKMKIIFLFSLAVCVAVTTAMPSKMPTNYNENYPVLKDELCNDHDFRTDNYNLFGQLVYLLLTLPNEENYFQNNCSKYLSISKKALSVLLRLKNIENTNYEKFDSPPKRTLDSIGGGHLIKRSDILL